MCSRVFLEVKKEQVSFSYEGSSKLALRMSPIYQAKKRITTEKIDETKNIITPQWKIMLIWQFPLDILHAVIYYIILSVSLIFARCSFKKMLGC